jgi:ascorbate-specific PTS system EIIC-type component UlaA
MNAEFLARIAGIALSLIFSYIPLAQKYYDTLDGIAKRLVMAGLLLLVAAITYGLSCWGVISGYVECTQAGLVSTIGFFIDALSANQAAFLISPKPKK